MNYVLCIAHADFESIQVTHFNCPIENRCGLDDIIINYAKAKMFEEHWSNSNQLAFRIMIGNEIVYEEYNWEDVLADIKGKN